MYIKPFICFILVAGGWNQSVNFHQLGLSLWGEVAAILPIATGPPDSAPAVSECVQRCWEEAATPKWCHLWRLAQQLMNHDESLLYLKQPRQCKVSTNPWNFR